mmetsp:Transcript_8426/g.21519  ORF Transcript_8426/g.21519 Transcript_8426/m.21519 type:complete len:544 (-) Transcript_8426:136-1767(-)|eukprot:CAMPEP_0206292028 /NCGR_PEP_ID=MMETSP0106_2-20121207/3416_1 /ASSEMBLY_ACC=CAM_ASM_000206 /TAXON_ID=81532 /ORGANISM="Acanthoeca-like sp., Strain 10tr" /LENGTH=543 /DNA_ID=CAMNT_0053722591 /DNA_START=44 /DNA_END=1675 /DNA_ORIENTATION=+
MSHTTTATQQPAGAAAAAQIHPAKKLRLSVDQRGVPTTFEVTIRPTLTEPYDVKMSMHAEIRANVLDRFRAGSEALGLAADGAIPPGSMLLVKGTEQPMRDDSDHEPIFRQESNFHYLFGVREPGAYGVIDVETGRSTLFMERLPDEYQIWMGKHRTLEDFKVTYEVDEVKWHDELPAFLGAREVKPTLYVINGVNSDSGARAIEPDFADKAKYTIDKSTRFFNAIIEARVFKTDAEIELMRHVNIVSSEAHLAVMQHCKPGLREYQLESLFRHWCYYHGGARFMAYTCICGSGPNCAALHYGHAGAPNDRTLVEGDSCLFDMGGEYHCYASDITNSFPASGKFDEDQKVVFEAALAANLGVIAAMKPGVDWVEMHALAYRKILGRLQEAGLVVGDIEDMMKANLGSIFMPHGLGHFMGKDTHDVGGYMPHRPERPQDFGFKGLRTATVLQERMCITVEPGVYFIDHLIEQGLANPEQAKFIDQDVLKRFLGRGGVRLEDDVIVTADGVENLSWTPRSIDEVEGVCQGRITSRFELACTYTKK